MKPLRHIIVLSILCLMTIHSTNVYAQTQSREPIEITADGSLEWHRAQKKFIAQKNATAIQGETKISAETLNALYRDNAQNDLEIYNFEALKNVIITTRDSQAFGDHAIYDIDKDKAIMTGDNLQILSPDQTLHADDQFEYFITKGELIAHGNATIIRPKKDQTGKDGKTPFDKIRADKISALFTNNDEGKRTLKTMQAFENVVITTPTEVITGKYGIYDADKNTAQITGNVKIKRGPNILEGEKADIDLNTNISTLFGAPGKKENGRVRGIFYPNSEKKK